jgi:L-asparaginase
VHKKLDTNIAILKLFPGISASVIKAITSVKELKAIIIETFGAGNGPVDKDLFSCLEEAINRGVVVLNVTQCNSGNVKQGLYQTSSEFKKIGITGGADITSEAAVTKLMFLLGRELPAEIIKKQLQQSLRGEITVD